MIYLHKNLIPSKKENLIGRKFCPKKSAIAGWFVLVYWWRCCSTRNLRLYFELLHLSVL